MLVLGRVVAYTTPVIADYVFHTLVPLKETPIDSHAMTSSACFLLRHSESILVREYARQISCRRAVRWFQPILRELTKHLKRMWLKEDCFLLLLPRLLLLLILVAVLLLPRLVVFREHLTEQLVALQEQQEQCFFWQRSSMFSCRDQRKREKQNSEVFGHVFFFGLAHSLK